AYGRWLPPLALSGVPAREPPAAAPQALVGVLLRGLPRAQPGVAGRPGDGGSLSRPRLAAHARSRVPVVAALRLARSRGRPRDGYRAVHVDPVPRGLEPRARGLAHHGADLRRVRRDCDLS